MKLNPEKCTFRVAFGKFLGYLVTQRRIEANLVHISAILEMKSATTVKEVQILNGRLAAPNHFFSRSTNKRKSFFLTTKKNGANFSWNDQCEAAFQSLKAYLVSPPFLSKPLPNETMFLYLVVFNTLLSTALIREDGGIQKPVYHVSKALIDIQTRYTRIEKLVFTFFTTWKLKHYFQSFSIIVLTEYPLRPIVENPEAYDRIAKCVIEIKPLGVTFEPRTAIKGFGGFYCRVHTRISTAEQPLERVDIKHG